MNSIDFIGYAAALLVLLTFYMKDMVHLRMLALCSNIAFLTYGLAIGATPVILLHIALMPINANRLLAELRARGFRSDVGTARRKATLRTL